MAMALFLYHYYDATTGPFRNLSSLPVNEAQQIQKRLKHNTDWYASQRADIDSKSMSFTYGDLFPTMRYKDDKPYRGKVYLKDEIHGVVNEFGWPQDWNKHGDLGPERYIEAQIWDDHSIRPFLEFWQSSR